jgi:hypothetical protein
VNHLLLKSGVQAKALGEDKFLVTYRSFQACSRSSVSGSSQNRNGDTRDLHDYGVDHKRLGFACLLDA